MESEVPSYGGVVNTYAGSLVDRVSLQRKDPEWLRTQEADSLGRYLPFRQLKILVTKTESFGTAPNLMWLARSQVFENEQDAQENKEGTVLLGLIGDIPHYAVDVTKMDEAKFSAHGSFEEARALSMRLKSTSDTAIIAHGRSIMDWHSNFKFCPKCGSALKSNEGGSKRVCTNATCSAEHYPRINPVAIVLVIKGDKCLLGRQPQFPAGLYSCVAGFMETAESLEECVRREVKEETGVRVGRVRYHSSQPWPFPSQLMLGCIAEAVDDHIEVDKDELEDAKWFSRDEVLLGLERSKEQRSTEFRVPPSIAIAHQLIKAWAVDNFAVHANL
eukprot:TRINITY_DN12516_c0_g1_i1.p1 TRINITY_DN12516_c0_g1~~TRINITY_DN12516_c0_g1_i1.p1  ORF type:complete len:331 (-),score=77.82 TRINITY_DN12516_c0_g1_i1:109-1101(-)